MSHFAVLLRRGASRLLVVLAIVLVWQGLSSGAAPKYGNSLDWVPADVAFYSCSLRVREQVEIVLNSNAYAKLANLPVVQMAWQFIQTGFNSPGGPGDTLQQFLAEPENQQLWDLVVEGLSTEIVAYGERNVADFIDIAQQTMNAIRYGSIGRDMKKGSDGEDDQELSSGRAALKTLDANRERLTIPSIVIGFKMNDAAQVKAQLARLEKLLQESLEDDDKLRGRLKHATIADVDYLTLELDGSLVPWDEIPWQKLEEMPGQFDKLQEKLKGMKLVFCIGMREGYLLFSMSSSTANLAAVGSGKPLAEMPELKPLEKFADRRLIGINYSSKAFMHAMSSADGQLNQLLQTVDQVLPYLKLGEEANQRIRKDAGELAGDLKAVLPEPGAQAGFSFLTPRGIEAYQYDWSENLPLDGSKSLSLLDHVGGNPLLAVVARTKHSPQEYATFRKWVQKAYGYFDEFAVLQFSEKEQSKYQQIKKAALPLIERWDRMTSQTLLPGLADGQTAVVFDAKINSKQWFEGFAQNKRSLPMLEPALVFGVSDSKMVKDSFVEYQSLANDVVEIIKQVEPEAIPADYKIPVPEESNTKNGTIYSYRLPKDLGVDPQIAPNGGLGNNVAVLSLAPTHTIQLLAETRLNVSPEGPFADREKPLAVALYFNWASTVEASTPWVDLLVRKIAAKGTEGMGVGEFLTDDSSRPELQPADDDPSTKAILDQVHTFLDVLKTLRTVESATSPESGVLVTHSVTEFRDVP